MKSNIHIIACSLAIVVISGCVRRSTGPRNISDYSRYNNSTREEVTLPSRSDIQRASSTVAYTLPTKVKALADKVERAYKSGRATANNLAEWVALYTEYCLEYSCALSKLTDDQCESIEYNLGRIAGYVYKDTITPIMEELDDINKGLEDYEERSKKWDGAAKKGFEDVTGVSSEDIFDY